MQQDFTLISHFFVKPGWKKKQIYSFPKNIVGYATTRVFITKNRRYHNEIRAFIKDFSYLKLKLRRYCC